MASPKTIHKGSLVDTTTNLHPNSTAIFAQWLPPNRAAAILDNRKQLDLVFAHRFSQTVAAGGTGTTVITLVRPMMLQANTQLNASRLVKAAYYEGGYVPGAVPSATGYASIDSATQITVNSTANAGEAVVWYAPDDGAQLHVYRTYNYSGKVQRSQELDASTRSINSINPYNRGSRLLFADPSILVDGFNLDFELQLGNYNEADALGNGGHGAWVDLTTDAAPVTHVGFDVVQMSLHELAAHMGNPHLSLVQMREIIRQAM